VGSIDCVRFVSKVLEIGWIGLHVMKSVARLLIPTRVAGRFASHATLPRRPMWFAVSGSPAPAAANQVIAVVFGIAPDWLRPRCAIRRTLPLLQEIVQGGRDERRHVKPGGEPRIALPTVLTSTF
jgi:hypothetical protein